MFVFQTERALIERNVKNKTCTDKRRHYLKDTAPGIFSLSTFFGERSWEHAREQSPLRLKGLRWGWDYIFAVPPAPATSHLTRKIQRDWLMYVTGRQRLIIPSTYLGLWTCSRDSKLRLSRVKIYSPLMLCQLENRQGGALSVKCAVRIRSSAYTEFQ